MCGQTVVAMLAHTNPTRVAALLGHAGPPTWRELYSVLHVLGVVCDVRQAPCFHMLELPDATAGQECLNKKIRESSIDGTAKTW